MPISYMLVRYAILIVVLMKGKLSGKWHHVEWCIHPPYLYML